MSADDETFLLRLVETYARDPESAWELLTTEKGRNKFADALSSRGLARAVREKNRDYEDDLLHVVVGAKTAEDLKRAKTLFGTTTKAIGIFAGLKKRRAIRAMKVYLRRVISRMNMDEIAIQAEKVAWLVGKRWQERLFLYLGSSIVTLGRTAQTENGPHLERAVAGLEHLESAMSRRLVKELRPGTKGGEPVVLDVDLTSVGVTTLQLSSAIRSVLRDRSIDVEQAGAKLGQGPHAGRAIHLMRFIAVSVVESPRVMAEGSMERSLARIREWIQSLRFLTALPTEPLESRLVSLAKHVIADATGNFVLMITPSTGPENISQYILQKGASNLWMRSLCGNKTYEAVPNRKDLLKDTKDGSTLRITKRGSTATGGGLKVFYASISANKS